MKNAMLPTLIIVAALAPTPSYAQVSPPCECAPQPLCCVQQEVDEVMRSWKRHREQNIEVKDIEGLASAQTDKEQLIARRKTLFIKRGSNREWFLYWKGEERSATRLAELYERLAPRADADKGRGLAEVDLPRLRSRLEGLQSAVEKQVKGVAQVIADEAAARTWLAARLAKVPKAVRRASSEGLERAVTKARLELGAAEKALAQAQVEAKQASQRQVTSAKDALVAAEAALSERRVVDVASALLAQGAVVTKNVPSGLPAEVAAKVTVIVSKEGRVRQGEAALKAAKVAEDEARAKLEAAEAAVERYRARRKVLDEWSALARDKQANQDIYFSAINADIVALNERLGSLEGQVEPEMLGKSDKVCAAPRAPGQTSLELYYACKRAIAQELDELNVLAENIRGSMALNTTQTTSIAELIKAQDTDRELADREREIAETEWRRARGAATEEDKWRGIWGGPRATGSYLFRATGKRESLRAALATSQVTERRLMADLNTLTVDLKSKDQRRGAVSASLAAHDSSSRWIGALLKTLWEYLRRAWMVPIYLLIAWLLLRLSGRVEAKIVSKARENRDDRDAVQRVETLSTVARGAFKLVVYIATLLMCLVAVGVDIGPLLGGAAIFGLAISFGSQSLVKDVVTGFFILLENQFAVGDYISTAGVEGTVETVTLRRTVLRDLRGTVHTVPNGSISAVSNMTQGWARVVIEIGVAYGTDLDKVQQLLDRLGDEFYAEEQWADKLQEPPRYVGMTKFDSSSIGVRLMFRTEQLENYAAHREMNRRIHDAFAREGIEIPYDKLDVTVISSPQAQAG